MTDFGDWIRGPTLASVHSGSQAQQRIRDLANLAAQLHEALVTSTAGDYEQGEKVRAVFRVAEEFMEKYG